MRDPLFPPARLVSRGSSLRRRIMNKRLVWLAPIALAALLSGCSVTVTPTGPIAPDSLVGYTIVFSHDRQEGLLPPHMGKFHFASARRALNAVFTEAKDWTYDPRSHGTATLLLVFTDDNSAAVKVTCELTFDRRDQDQGEHECEYVQSTTIAFLEIRAEGSSEGDFVLRKIGSDGP